MFNVKLVLVVLLFDVKLALDIVVCYMVNHYGGQVLRDLKTMYLLDTGCSWSLKKKGEYRRERIIVFANNLESSTHEENMYIVFKTNIILRSLLLYLY